MGTGVFLFRPVGAGVGGVEFSYVEMIFPSDFCCASVRWGDTQGQTAKAVLHSELFPESLEKGVIRRARLRGLFVPRADDLVTASQLFAEFAASPPPLTT
jgi:hypothetical protein